MAHLAKPSPNSKQRLVRWLGLALLLGMGLIPPWKVSYSVESKEQFTSAGYHPIWRPPAAEQELPENAIDPKFQVSLTRVLVQFAAVLGLVNGGYYLLRSKEP